MPRKGTNTEAAVPAKKIPASMKKKVKKKVVSKRQRGGY